MIPQAPHNPLSGESRTSFKDLVELCMELSQEDFRERQPNPVLLFSAAHAGEMRPVKKTRTKTLDRLVVGETPESGVPTVDASNWYTVYELVSRRVPADRISLGCSRSCDVQLDDVSVSRIHAWINHATHGYYLEDADSSAGTALNGRTLEPGQSVMLSSGDRISVGNVDLVFLPSVDFHVFVRRLAGLWRS